MATAKNAKKTTAKTTVKKTVGRPRKVAGLTVQSDVLDAETIGVLEGQTNAEAIAGTVPPKKTKTARQTKKETGPEVTRVPVDLHRILQTVKLTDLFAAMTEDQARQSERFFINRRKARTAEEASARGAFVPNKPERAVLSGTVMALRDHGFSLVGNDASVHSKTAIPAAIDRLPYIAMADAVDPNFIHLDHGMASLKRTCQRIVSILADEVKLQKTGRIS